MRLTKLELNGFKSFADQTQLIFEPGVTAIVGPNGCGKSNVSDAVRWVLGEQRARLLRGAKMEEVIFQGSSSRRPVNVADVSLHFENDDGSLPVAFREVVITRRLSRSGESEYLLNGSSCRLRDIHDLMRGTGLGADAGVVIEARMIDALLSDRPDERRELFEEAAGVGLYRDRKRSTERRLEETNLDLARLDDLIAEVQSQVRSLARQRRRAERHAELAARRFTVELALAAREMAAWKEELQSLQDRVTALRVEHPGAVQSARRAETDRDERHGARTAAEAHRAELARLESSLRESLLHLQGELAVAEERQRNSKARRERAEGERREGEAHGTRLSDELSEAAAQREHLQHELATATEDMRRHASSEESEREAFAAARTSLELLEEESRQAAATVHRLQLERESAEQELEDLSARLATLSGERDHLGIVAADTRQDLAAAVQESERAGANAQLLETAHEAAQAALSAARAREKESTARLFRIDDTLAGLEGRIGALEALERERVGLGAAAAALLNARDEFGDGAILGPISDYINADAQSATDIESYLGQLMHAVLVRDRSTVDAVVRWHEHSAPGALVLLPLDGESASEIAMLRTGLANRTSAAGTASRWTRALLGAVTRRGDEAAFVDEHGAVWLPGPPIAAGPIRRRAEHSTLRAEHARLMKDRESAVQAAHGAQLGALEAESGATESLESAATASRAVREADDSVVDLRRRLDRADRDIAEVDSRQSRIRERAAQLEERLREIGETHVVVDEMVATLGKRVSTSRDALTLTREALDGARDVRAAGQVEVAQLEARLSVAVDRTRRLQEERDSAANRAASLQSELETLSSGDALLSAQMADRQAQIDSRHASLHDAQTRLVAAEQAVLAAENTLTDAEHALDSLRRHAADLSDELHHSELRLSELSGRKTAIRERLEAEWRRPLDEMLSSAEPLDMTDEDLRAEAGSLRDQLEALGPVNPFAIEEHSEESRRADFLVTQRTDLADARTSLQEAIREIDNTARDLFLATFTRIRENFRHIFMTLFGGGECDVRLENPDAPLECDIEIHASPRGKRTQRIHLLSSGERALVALSLLFGIFLTKPSPFCLLDEVDAPLDDQNIGRFVRMLGEFKKNTQFIVITHNPRTTTEAADAVYGVTMQEPGVSSLVSVRLSETAAGEAA